MTYGLFKQKPGADGKLGDIIFLTFAMLGVKILSYFATTFLEDGKVLWDLGESFLGES